MSAQLDMFAAAPTGNGPEHYELPLDRKGWQGMPLAEIDLAFDDGGWRQRSAAALPGGSGYARPFHQAFPSRSSALCSAIKHVQRFASGDSTDERRIRTWLETIS